MNAGHIGFGVTTLIILAFFSGCDSRDARNEAAQNASMQDAGGNSTGDGNENDPSDGNQKPDGSGEKNASDSNQSAGSRNDGNQDAGSDGEGSRDTGHESESESESDGNDDTFSVGGTLSGLISTASIVFQNNGTDDLTVSLNGPFTFATKLADGAAYKVTIRPQSEGQICEVSKGEGHIDGADVTDVAITCADPEEIDTGWARVSAGHGHACAIRTDGRLFCWGGNGLNNWGIMGQLGNNSTEDSPVPVQEHTRSNDWAQVSAGYGHTCAIKTDGRLFCWGYNEYGQLGNNSTENSLVPVQERTSSSDWALVSAGSRHTCGVKTDGRLFCWGGGGQLANNSLSDSLVPVQEGTAASDWAQVSAASDASCAIKTDGRLFCWGGGSVTFVGPPRHEYDLLPVQESSNASDWARVSIGSKLWAMKSDGRLFWSSSSGWEEAQRWEEAQTPEQDGTASTKWAQVSSGDLNAYAITTDGQLLCEYFGEFNNRETPYLATANWAQVSSGYDYACALKVDGRLFCWGDSDYGQLGNNVTSQNSFVPVQEHSAAADWVQISVRQHGCAVKRDGRLFCWGGNQYGQLGNNSTTDTKTLEPVQENTTASDWVQVSTAGRKHTCAVKSDGRLFCWGNNGVGQLGNNSTENSSVPVQENTKAVDWAQVSTAASSSSHTCAVKSDGALFCWGVNTYGQLGNNSTENSSVPLPESTKASDWAQVASGDAHTCAVKTDGRLFCWGNNDNGQLGDNSQSDSLVPVQEDTEATDWVQVSANFQYTCAMKSDGRLFCWGAGQDWQSAYRGDMWVPLQEYTEASDWARVSTGTRHTCAVKSDGRLFCWGDNETGALGNDSVDCGINEPGTCLFTPVQEATGAADWAEVSTSTGGTCARKTDGRLFCWGAGAISTFGPVRLTN